MGRSRRTDVLTRIVFVGLLAAIAGCPSATGNAPTKDPDEPSPGDSFDNAPLIELDANGSARVSDFISSSQDVHVFDVGALAPGDRIIVDVAALQGGDLDPTCAIFDANGELFTVNDDLDLSSNRLQSHIDEIIREASDHYFVAVAASFFSNGTGPYSATIQIERGGSPVLPTGQMVFLNFAGGTASIPGVGTFEVPPFRGDRIDPAYVDDTAFIVTTVINVVNENFEGLNVTIRNSRDHARPADPFSEIFFGEFNANAFGISESVDHWNNDLADESIIFTDRFDDPFSTKPSAEGIAVAIANVASHEVGHLLGLEHTADITDLMDTTGTASTLLGDQDFGPAPLDESVFPIGTQDGLQLLMALLGATP